MKKEDLTALFKQMTLEEKIGQTVQLTGNFFDEGTASITGPMLEMNVSDQQLYQIGSVLGGAGAADIKRIQAEYLQQNRLGIPMLFMADVIHGYQSIYPIPLALASSWNTELIEGVAALAAKESAVSGVQVTFSPMVDLVRDARWGRVMETTGEDPFLNEELAKAQVRGYQGEDLLQDTDRLAACVKHFAGYGAPVGGRDYNTVDLSEHVLRESYLSGYQAAIDEGAKLVMASFNTIKGVPATGNQWLLQDVLRGEMKFDGVLISDWAGINELIAHGVAADLKEAAKQSLLAGIDIDMMAGAYLHHLKDLIEEEPELEDLLDQAVWRVLNLKNELGLFENPYRGADEARESAENFSAEHRQLVKEAAEQSIVLLKNNGVLPLKAASKIALVGPKSQEKDLLGSWSLNGQVKDTLSLVEVLSERVDLKLIDEADVFKGPYSFVVSDLYAAETIVVALGEDSFMSGEAASRSNIQLPENQLLLLRELKKTGKPIVAVIVSGRPLDLTEVDLLSDAVVEVWFPGSEGAAAISDILTGKVNPSGKLSMTFPRNVGQVPIYYNHHTTGRPFTAQEQAEKYVSRYLDVENTPLYPFGFGLSYTSFDYQDLKISQTDEVTVTLTNTGDRAGTEIVQLYIRDRIAEVVRPVKELKGFQRVSLEAKESKVVSFQLNTDMFKYIHQDGQWDYDTGEFEIMVGPNSQDVLITTLHVTKD